jgi:hypothetical protein
MVFIQTWMIQWCSKSLKLKIFIQKFYIKNPKTGVQIGFYYHHFDYI